MMLNDFHKMLNASEYFFITIEIEPREIADFDETTGLTDFRTKISIAGNMHNFIIPCQLTSCDNSAMAVNGFLNCNSLILKLIRSYKCLDQCG